MNKKDFLDKISKLLATLPTEEKENALKFYEDIFNDAENETEEQIIARLDSPEEIAAEILKSNGCSPEAREKTGTGAFVVKSILLALASPIIISVLAGILGAYAGVVGGLLGLAAGLAGQAVWLLILGFINLFNGFATGLLVLGAALILSAIAAIAFMPIMKLIYMVSKFLAKGLKWCWLQIFPQRKAA